MSNALKWHLLKETSDIILERVKRRIDDSWLGSGLSYPNVNFLGTWLMSGKESAAIVRMILSQHLGIRNSFTAWAQLGDKRFVCFTVPGHLENMALRWTHFLKIYNFQRSPEFSSFIHTLRDYNCVEKLSLKTSEHLSVDNCVAIVEVCQNLSTLICPPDLLVSLFERVKTPALSKLHTIETTESANKWSLFFENLNSHAKQRPVLETLSMTLEINDLKTLSKLATDSLPTINSYNIKMKPYYRDPIDFSLIASILLVFPNLETASVTVDEEYDYSDPINSHIPIKLTEVYKSFEKFNSKVKFMFNYILEYYENYSETQVDELEVQLRTWGTITSVSREDDQLEYSVTTSYPNKTLNLSLWICVDTGEEKAEDSEDDDDAEDSEEGSLIGDDDEEGFEVEDAEQDSEEDLEGEGSDGEPEKKRMKFVRIMSNDQLRWHLLREVCHMLMDDIFRLDVACLGPLIMSGKGPPEAVKLMLSCVETLHDSSGIYVRWNYNDRCSLRIEPVYLYNLALRWSRVVDIKNYGIDKLCESLVPLLADYNSIEKLTLHTPNSSVMPIIDACSNLSDLTCRPEVFVALFQQEKTVFSKLRTVEVMQFRGVWKDLFEPWTKRPEQCPVLESLTVPTLYGMKDLSESIPTGVVPSLKSLNIEWEAVCCSAVPFSMFVSMCKLFPNLETASFTLIAECKHRHMKLSEVYDLFKEFDLKAKLTFTYYHAHKCEYNRSKLLRLRERLAKNGTITAIQQSGEKYWVRTSYPNKTMMLRALIKIANNNRFYKHDDSDNNSEDSG